MSHLRVHKFSNQAGSRQLWTKPRASWSPRWRGTSGCPPSCTGSPGSTGPSHVELKNTRSSDLTYASFRLLIFRAGKWLENHLSLEKVICCLSKMKTGEEWLSSGLIAFIFCPKRRENLAEHFSKVIQKCCRWVSNVGLFERWWKVRKVWEMELIGFGKLWKSAVGEGAQDLIGNPDRLAWRSLSNI